MADDLFKPQTGNSYRILIVDDTPEQQRILLELLRSSGFNVTLAFDGHQGYQRALSSKPDLILLDVRMARMDGFATCRLLKADAATHDIPVIFLTAAGAPDERINGLKMGGVDYISKPFVPEEVIARINIHLDLALRVRAPQPSTPSTQPLRHNPNIVLVNAVKQFISENLACSPSLAEIANKVGTYEKKLSQVFREQTGLTVFAFIREERIRRARALLEDTDLEIQDIADQVGFQNAANFTTAFRQRLGITPSAYRLNLSTS
ncbi:sensory transduction histidine kinase, putative [Ricinus communis]|uniref:Sensory transduction histidine kinase, putative n=1 Tax=Ricinus communis TaxID=3988 RepID=B9TFC4_RICCO|nr:sensory transduction histidine kinase, putative [Ricinus communis]